MSDEFTLERFQPYVNDTFKIISEDNAPLQATLLEATAVGSPPAPNNGVTERQAFSLLFHVSGNSYLEQQIFNLTHPALGSLALFMVPVGQDQQGYKYEAMFT